MTIVVHEDWERWARSPGPRRGSDTAGVWGERACDLLRALWTEGRSASAIASRLGEGFTRNAVIGKAHRLGLEKRPSPIQLKHGKRRRRRSSGATGPGGSPVVGARLAAPVHRRCAGCAEIFSTSDLNTRHCAPCRGARP
ncbi:MAG: GcrA family cell cycle regulator [Alphaproteobacteria bacterium]